MIDLPDSYRVGSAGRVLNKKEFLPSHLTTAARTRLRNALKRVVLTHQIVDESVPSLINDSYKCVALLFLDVELEDISQAPFAAQTIQALFKPFVRIHFSDAKGRHCLSYARKRLNRNDSNAVVIVDEYCSAPTPGFDAHPLLRFESLVNRTNKRDLYLEAMTKHFLIDHPKLFIGAGSLLESKLWYDGSRILELYSKLTAIQGLKNEKESCKSLAAKADINKRLKVAIQAAKVFSST